MTFALNPILPGCYPDPTICRLGEDYYLVTSTFEYFPGLPIFHSRDLANWEQIGHVIDRPGQLDFGGIASSGGLYAPTLRHGHGKFWLVCTLVDQSDPARGGNFLVTATDPAGPWSDPIWLGVDGIDPSIFFDDDGRIWMHGTRLVTEPEWHDQTEVWVQEYDPEAEALIGPEHVIWNGALRDVVWAEAPHLYRVDGTYYLVAAEGGTEFHHAVSVARSDSVTGPYVGSKGNPVLTHRHLGGGNDVVGVGHADLVEAVDGSWWAVLLAMRPYGGYHYNLGRETFLVPVIWQDGWPVFAPGVGRLEARIELPWPDQSALGVSQGRTSGIVDPTDPRWTSLRGPATQFATPDGQGWVLAMSPNTLAEARTPAFLGVRQQHMDVDVTARIEAEIGDGEEVGLAIRQSEDHHARFFVTRDGELLHARAVHRSKGVDKTLGEVAIVDAGATRLRICARGQDYRLEVYADGQRLVAVLDGRALDSVSTGGFLGLWFGVYASSNGQPTETTARIELDYRPADGEVR